MPYLPQDKARYLRDAGEVEIGKLLSTPRVSIAYEPAEWELEIVDDRIHFYQGLDAVGNIQQRSRDRLGRLILSLESIIRRKGRVAFPKKKDSWTGKISDRIPIRLVNRLQEIGYLISREIQVSKKPNVFDPSPEFLEAIPIVPEGAIEGRLRSDKPWQPIVIYRRYGEEALENFANPPNPIAWDIEALEQEMLELNAWFEESRGRIKGLDDLRFHRVFHFNPHWGGRLYGEFTSMDRVEDRPRIMIDGQETTEADLNGSYLSFFLLINGIEELPNDPYQHGELADYNRSFVKQVFLRLFGRGAWWKRSFVNALNTIRDQLGYPDGLPNYTIFQEAACATYPALEGFNQYRPTFTFERYESRALLNTLLWLQERGEVGLPIHDGIRVRADIQPETEIEFKRQRALVCADFNAR